MRRPYSRLHLGRIEKKFKRKSAGEGVLPRFLGLKLTACGPDGESDLIRPGRPALPDDGLEAAHLRRNLSPSAWTASLAVRG